MLRHYERKLDFNIDDENSLNLLNRDHFIKFDKIVVFLIYCY